MMRDRLLLIKELLSPDGSIWVHLDDAEAHRMRSLLEEVLGPENFITTVICAQWVPTPLQSSSSARTEQRPSTMSGFRSA